MPQVQKSEFTVAEKGTYLAQLCDIEQKVAMQKSDSGDDRESKFWVWKFRGYLTKDTTKKMVPIEVTSGCGVSSKQSALKHILSCAFPDMTLDEMSMFNTDEMVGKAWVLKVSVEETAKGSKKNVILNIEPSDKDPFSDDDED